LEGELIEMEDLLKYLPFIIPLLVIELGLLVFVIVDIIRKKKTKNLKPWIWVLIAVCLSSTFIGPVLYIIFGRAEVEIEADAGDDDI